MNLKRTICAMTAGAAMALPLAAQAADMPVKAPIYKAPPPVEYSSWTGCYIGANVGGGSARERYIDPLAVPPDNLLGSHDATGVVGGGQFGCDYQSGPWVFGLQGMIDGSDMRGSHLSVVAGDIFRNKIPWFATATARAGFTLQPNLLAYVKAGGVWKRDNETVIDGVTLVPEGSARANRTGFVVGGGFEYMFAGNWSLFAEGDYLAFGDRSITFTNLEVPPVPPTFPLNIRENIAIGLVGINYRFNAGPIVARY